MRCAVYGCNNTNCGSCPATGINYYSFPKDKKKQKAWVVLCRRKDKFNVNSARVCSVHFNPEDYKPNIDDFFASYGLENSRKKLLPGAVPSQHLPKKVQNEAQIASKLARSERAHKRLAVSFPTEDATISSENVLFVEPNNNQLEPTFIDDRSETASPQLEIVLCVMCGSESPFGYLNRAGFNKISENRE